MSFIRIIVVGLLVAAFAAAQDRVEDWVADLQKRRDDADVSLVQKLADARTRTALEGLLRVYDSMESIYMRREIVRAIARFDGVAEAEQPAMQKLTDIALESPDAELRDAAVEGLGGSGKLGRSFLRRIVDAETPDEVREKALRAHVKRAAAEDVDWYRHVWNFKDERRKGPDGKLKPLELPTIRQLAFGGVVPHMAEEEIVDVLRNERDPKIRRAGLTAMHERRMPKTADMAAWLLERVDFPGADRAVAGRILVECNADKAVIIFLTLAKKRDVTQEDLRLEMARLITEIDDDSVVKKVTRLIGKGKPHERVFALQATQRVDDPKVLAAVRKELQAREPEVRRAAAEALGARRDKESLDELRALLAKPKTPQDQRVAIEAISAIEQGSGKWLAELDGMAAHADRDVRNAALEQIALAKDTRRLPLLLVALNHEDWTTRWIAIGALVALRDKQAVPKLIERLGKEGGRMATEIGDALWRLSGQPFDEDGSRWRTWWDAEGGSFEVISAADLEKAGKERELRRLKQRTRSGAKFFGIRIESHRVIFIIDVSGSMLESVHGRYVDDRGAARIDVAKEELSQAIKNLDEGSLFNVFAFSSGIGRWLKTGIGDSSSQSRQAALTWVERLGASGGTNLYDSLKLAFDDQDVDTIFLLSDGEPTAGEVIDPHGIREDIAFWNKHRRVVIHTVSVGGNLEVLEWLAKDSGGKHVHIR